MTAAYPSEETLQRIKDWPWPDWRGLLRFIDEETDWNHYGRLWFVDDNTCNMATGGWSGNEEIINSMQSNWAFWSVCWKSSVRGGLFTFKLP